MKIMNLLRKLLVYLLFFISAVVVAELVLLFFLGEQRKLITNSLTAQQSEKNNTCPVVTPPEATSTNEATLSCNNWFSKYKYIDSSETTTKGVFSHMEENPKTHETKVFFTGQGETYYVSFDSNVTKVTILNLKGEKLDKSSLKKGDNLSVVEKYLKTNNVADNFSVIITKQ